MPDLFYTELSLANISKPFDGMAVGKFRTSQGEVNIEPDELDEYVQNTKDVLESTRSESGDIVGLPIDPDAHNHEGGAGWITDVVRDGNLLRFIPKWTEAGKKIIEEGTRRFFSPSFDPEQKVIIGGSLTNYPASRDEKRRIKLRPVELSETMFYPEYEIQNSFAEFWQEFLNKLGSLSVSQVPPATEETVDESHKGGVMPNSQLAELAANAGTPEGLAELNDYINQERDKRVKELVEAQSRKSHLSELAETLVGGSKDHPRGLPVDKDKFVEFMSALSPEQAKEAEALFKAIQEKGMVEFEEEGHTQKVVGKIKLSPEMAILLQSALDEGISKEAFFKANQDDLGEMKDYDLSMFVEKEAK